MAPFSALRASAGYARPLPLRRPPRRRGAPAAAPKICAMASLGASSPGATPASLSRARAIALAKVDAALFSRDLDRGAAGLDVDALQRLVLDVNPSG